MLQDIEGLQLHGHLTTDAIRGCFLLEKLLFHSSITIIIKFGKFGHYQDIEGQVDLSNNYNCDGIIQ